MGNPLIVLLKHYKVIQIMIHLDHDVRYGPCISNTLVYLMNNVNHTKWEDFMILIWVDNTIYICCHDKPNSLELIHLPLEGTV